MQDASEVGVLHLSYMVVHVTDSMWILMSIHQVKVHRGGASFHKRLLVRDLPIGLFLWTVTQKCRGSSQQRRFHCAILIRSKTNPLLPADGYWHTVLISFL